ncbi:MAG: TlpA family protein disulfide reductase [Bacteroidales bacterium]|jgi:peroxiredoxin|nr:TlpA family protein disulfide reductase [Bacteroidales bacterium]
MLLVTAGTFSAFAQKVKISGNAPDYAGQTLKLYGVDNYISHTEIIVAECTVAADGEFKFEFPIAATHLLYMYLGVFKARMFAEPAMSYRIALPPRMDKTPAEASSPFFEEELVYLQIASCTDMTGKQLSPENELNWCATRFDVAYNAEYDRIAMDALRQKTIRLDSVINAFKQQFPENENVYFKDYTTYRYGLLYYTARQKSVKFISEHFFTGKPILYSNDAYMDLFNVTYKDYFMYFGRTKEGQAIYDIINVQKDLGALKKLLKSDGIFTSDSLLEMVIIKNLYDEFYSDRFARQSLLAIFDSIIDHSTLKRHVDMGLQMKAKITKLLRGYAPPAFSLYNQDSTLVSLSNYKGKYVYLLFCTTQNYVCLSQYEMLKDLYKAQHKWLRIVVISADDNFANMRDFRRKSGYLWEYLHFGNQPDVMQDYDIRMFPTYFLINPEGKLLASPAPEAGEIGKFLLTELTKKGLLQEYMDKGLMNRKSLEQLKNQPYGDIDEKKFVPDK